MEGRRGFLIGAAKLIGAGLTLAAVPSALAVAKDVEPLLWTPDRDLVPGRAELSNSTIGPYGPIYVSVHRGDPVNPIMQYGVGPDQNFVWMARPERLVFARGHRLQRILVAVDVLPELA
jgi:hypothetical protein